MSIHTYITSNYITYLTATHPTKAILSDMHGHPGLKGGKQFQCFKQSAIPLF